MKKRKLFIALLASLCVSAGAAAMAACSTEKHDPALYAAYQTYVESTDNPMSYEEWVKDLLLKLANTENAQDGLTPEIGGNGNWWIGDIDTGVKAEGAAGAQGATGRDGKDGKDGDDGVGIVNMAIWKDVNNGDKLYLEITFSNGKVIRLPMDGQGDPIENTSFTIKAVDQNGDPVADAYLYIGYRDSSFIQHYLTEADTYTTSALNARVFKTNNSGVIEYYTFGADSGLEYRAFPASEEILGKSPTPEGYTGPVFGIDPELELAETSARFVKGSDGNYSLTLNYVLSNSWGTLYEADYDLQYKRYVSNVNTPDNITEDYVPYVKRAAAGRYNYFSFAPYRFVDPLNESDYDKALIQARDAAKGVYRFSWTANNPEAHVSLYAYSFLSGQYYLSNEDGSPSSALIAMQSDDNNHSVEISVTDDNAGAMFCLGFVADADCEVTITVERVGEVAEWTDKTETPSATETTQADENEGRILDVPLPLERTVVKGGDGYYHLDSATGPVIYVQLNSPTRANTMSMAELCDVTTSGIDSDGHPIEIPIKVFRYLTEETFDEATNSGTRTYTDFTEAVRKYGTLANSDGLFPVNDQLKTILEFFCSGAFVGINEYDNYWVYACYYYGPVSDGSEEAPYDLNVGEDNQIAISGGIAYVAFRTATAGCYGFSSDGTISGITDGITVDGVVYVEVPALTEIVFTVSSSQTTANISVVEITDAQHIRYYETTDDGTVRHGTEESPLTVRSGNEAAVYQVTVAKEQTAYSGPLVIDVRALIALFNGNYKITVYGSTTATIVDGEGHNVIGEQISVTSTYSKLLYIDDVADGTFFIKIEKVD